jgi:Xaa-Pro aminopeptidase
VKKGKQVKNKRLQKLRAILPGKAVDGMLVTHGSNVRYLSGFDGGSDGYLIITDKKAVLATDSRYWEQAEREAPGFELFKTTGPYTTWFPGLLKDLGITYLGFEGGNVSYDLHGILRGALKKAQVPVKLLATNGIVEKIRIVKEPDEIVLLQKAAEITDATFNAVAPRLKAGMTELQIAWELEKAFHDNGSEGLAFPTIVGSGPNAALAHAKPSSRIVGAGEPIVIDMGGIYQGYKNDITRTVCVGKADARFKEIYNIVLEAQQTASIQIRTGMTGKEADAIARDIIVKAGYGADFGHSLGHGVGLEEHESPRLAVTSGDILEDGMVFTVEPGIYLTGWGGVRIEDTVRLVNGKAVSFNSAVKADYR